MQEDKKTQVEETQTPANKEEKTEAKLLTQEEVDKVLAERLSRQREKSEKEKAEAIEAAVAEANRLAQLSAEEREREQRAQIEQGLTEREKKLALRENKATALEKLAEYGMPTRLADLVVTDSTDSTLEAIEKLKESWTVSLEETVKSKLEGKAPRDLGNGDVKPTRVITSF